MNEKILANEALKGFLAACDSSREQARGDLATFVMEKEEGIRRAKEAWTALHRARIFVINPLTFAKFYRMADVYTTEVLAQMKWDGPKEIFGKGTIEEEIQNKIRYIEAENDDPEKLMVVCHEHGRFMPFPASTLPFDAVFLGYGPMGVSIDNVGARVGIEGMAALLKQGFRKFQLNGHLLAVSGDTKFAYSFVSGARPNEPNKWHTMVLRAFADNEWDHAYDLDPWVVPSIITAINQYKTYQETNWSPGQRLERKQRKDSNSLPVPKPYYLVHLEDDIIRDIAKGLNSGVKPQREFSYRFDVRGHECVKILRGKLPLDSDIQYKLQDRGYRIYIDKDPIDEDNFRILRRKIRPKDSTEWMAILNYWRDAHIRGPEDKPYVPAMRLLK